MSVILYEGSKIVGLYEENFYKLPENQLIMGFIEKTEGGKIKSKFREEGDEEIVEDDDNIIGTIKILIDHVS